MSTILLSMVVAEAMMMLMQCYLSPSMVVAEAMVMLVQCYLSLNGCG